MSLGALLGGADCGPSNPLQSLLKLDQDRGQHGQTDRFLPIQGSSQQAIQASEQQHAAAREAEAFFRGATPQPGSHAFDLKPLGHALGPESAFQIQQQQQQQQSHWAAEYANQKQQPAAAPALSESHLHSSPAASQMPRSSAALRPLSHQTRFRPYYQPQPGSHHASQKHAMIDQSFEQAQQDSQWERAFQDTSDLTLREGRSASPPLTQNQRTPESDAALAQTASDVLRSISREDDHMEPKMQQSQFLDLMRKIRDYEVVVDGDQIVNNPEAASAKGKQRAAEPSDMEPEAFHPMASTSAHPHQYESESEAAIEGYEDVQDIWEAEDRARMEEHEELLREGTTPLRRQFQGDGGAIMDDEEAFGLDEGIDERFDAANIIGSAHEAPGAGFRVQSRVDEGWNHLQDEWDAWQADSSGVQPVSQDGQKHHGSAQEWMGVATLLQEQEHEARAIEALRKALSRDSKFAPAWLALSASLSNESQRGESLDALASWIASVPRFSAKHQSFEALQGTYDGEASVEEKHAYLTSSLLSLVQVSSAEQSGLDPDLQVGLGVLFNSSNEPAKAADCFMAALSVRPDDHQLYNRIGAALANSGQPEEALRAYEEALRLQPSYARARYNMAVSLLHLQRYREAASQLAAGLRHQQEDGGAALAAFNSQEAGQDSDIGRFSELSSATPMSQALWDSLETCWSLMGRTEMVMASKAKNLGEVERALA